MTLTDLPLTKVKAHQGSALLRLEPMVGSTSAYPGCTNHGSMNRVAAEKDWWRCLECNIGVEWDR